MLSYIKNKGDNNKRRAKETKMFFFTKGELTKKFDRKIEKEPQEG
jgi:hypothetical protein